MEERFIDLLFVCLHQSNAAEKCFLISLNTAIQHLCLGCRRCIKHSMSQPPASNIISAPPQYQFQQTVTDLSETEGHDILIYASRYLGWIGVARLGSKVRRMVRQDFLK